MEKRGEGYVKMYKVECRNIDELVWLKTNIKNKKIE